MTTLGLDLPRSRHRDEWMLRRKAAEGWFWQAEDGLIVRVAAAESAAPSGTRGQAPRAKDEAGGA